MEYLISFEDGSTGHLTHYGVKGMKWGVWNAETSARYSSGKSDDAHRRAVESASISAAANLVKLGRGVLTVNPVAAATAFGSAYVSSRAGSAIVKAGQRRIDKLVKDPEKREKAKQKLEDRVGAAQFATVSAATTLAGSGNPVAAGMAFGIGYTSARISKAATRAGKPVIDKLVKDPEKRSSAAFITEMSLRAATGAGLTRAGAGALNALVQAHYDSLYTPHAHSLPGSFFGVNAKPHGSATQTSHGISEQLSSANIPEWLASEPNYVYRKRP